MLTDRKGIAPWPFCVLKSQGVGESARKSDLVTHQPLSGSSSIEEVRYQIHLSTGEGEEDVGERAISLRWVMISSA